MLEKSSHSFRSIGVYLRIFYFLFCFDDFSIDCWLYKPNETLVIICWRFVVCKFSLVCGKVIVDYKYHFDFFVYLCKDNSKS